MNSRMHIAIKACTLAWLGMIPSSSFAAETPGESLPKPATAVPEEMVCASPVARIWILDDSLNVAPALQDLYRDLRTPTPAQIARKVSTANSCLDLLDAEPALAAIPGAALPDVVFRIRPERIRLGEQSLGKKADTAVRRYIGSYLGESAPDAPVLQRISMALQLICPRQRRVVREFVAEDDIGDGENAVDPLEQNAERIISAYKKIEGDAVSFLKEANPCGSPQVSDPPSSKP